MTELHLTGERLPGFYRQRDDCMYSTLAFVVPVTLLRLPYSLASALAWAAIVYYPVNLAPEASRFFTFILLLFLLHKYGPEHNATTFCGVLHLRCTQPTCVPQRGLLTC